MSNSMSYMLDRACNRSIDWTKKLLKKLLRRNWIYYEDNFTRFLNYINPGMLEPGNVYAFDYVIRNLDCEGAILEIGSFAGLSTNLVIYFLEKHHRNNRFITVDPWKLRDDSTPFYNGKFAFKEYNSFVKDSFKRNVSFFNPDHLPYTIEDVSSSFFEKWKHQEVVNDVFGRSVKLGGALSFCYIDGDHAPASVELDFTLCDQYLARNGFMLFDDSTWDDVNVVMHKILATGRYKLVMRNPNYLFQKIA